MSLPLRLLFGLLMLVALLGPSRSEAADVRLGLGGHYWFNNGALFDLNLGVSVPVAGPLSVGGRFGLMLETGSNTMGLPLDLLLRVQIARTPVYLEGTVGPWIFFSGDAFRAHGGFGFGLQTGGLSIGVEAGVLGSSGLLGLRLGLRL